MWEPRPGPGWHRLGKPFLSGNEDGPLRPLLTALPGGDPGLLSQVALGAVGIWGVSQDRKSSLSTSLRVSFKQIYTFRKDFFSLKKEDSVDVL